MKGASHKGRPLTSPPNADGRNVRLNGYRPWRNLGPGKRAWSFAFHQGWNARFAIKAVFDAQGLRSRNGLKS
jgi:hypothetical protein